MNRVPDLSPEHQAIVCDILSRHLPTPVRVSVFGSRATGKARRYSDLDLVLEGPSPIPRAVMVNLAESFDESDLPWKVDLIDWHTISDQFRGAIASDRIVLMPRDDSQV